MHTANIDVWNLFPVFRNGNKTIRTSKRERSHDTGLQINVSIVNLVDEKLNLGFKDVLVLIEPGIDFALDLPQLLDHIDGGLLVAFGGCLEQLKCALKLQSLVVVLDEARSNRGVKGNVLQTLEGV
jgi:hypothetical protein